MKIIWYVALILLAVGCDPGGSDPTKDIAKANKANEGSSSGEGTEGGSSTEGGGTETVVDRLRRDVAAFAEKLQVKELAAGSIVTQLGYGFAINKGSSLERKFYVVDDPACPAYLEAAGFASKYKDRNYSFVPQGDLLARKPLAAVEVIFLFFDIWGEHLKTLSATEVRDLAAEARLPLQKIGAWRTWAE